MRCPDSTCLKIQPCQQRHPRRAGCFSTIAGRLMSVRPPWCKAAFSFAHSAPVAAASRSSAPRARSSRSRFSRTFHIGSSIWSHAKTATPSSSSDAAFHGKVPPTSKARSRWRRAGICAGIVGVGYLADKELNASALARTVRVAYYRCVWALKSARALRSIELT